MAVSTTRRTILSAMAGAALPMASSRPAFAEIGSCDKPIKFGTTISQTGPFSDLTQPWPRMTRAFADEVNARGGIPMSGCGHGVPIEWVIYDDQSNPATAASLFERMATVDNVDFFVGVDWSPLVAAASLVAERHKIPLIACAASTPSLYDRGLKYFWATSIPQIEGWSSEYFKLIGEMTPKPKTIFFVTHDQSTMRALTDYYVNAATTSGLQIVGRELFSQDLKDFTPIVVKLRSAKPDLIYIASYDSPSVPLVQQMRQMQVPAMDVHHVMLSGALVHQVGQDANGMTGDIPWVPGGGGAYHDLIDAVLKKAQVDTFEYIWTPGRLAAYLVAIQALQRAGTVDREKVREALYKGRFDTLVGPIQFDERGYTSGPATTIQIQDGKVVVVSPADRASGKMIWPSPSWR